MKYLCLVYLEEGRLDELPDEDCVAYDAEIRDSGHCLASEAIEWVRTATTVRVRNGSWRSPTAPSFSSRGSAPTSSTASRICRV